MGFGNSFIWRRPFQYSLLVTSTLLPKLLHLYIHITSLQPLLTLLYLPTFLALDVVNAAIFWIIVHIAPTGRGSTFVAVIRGGICLGILSASSSQIGFYLETGGELRWGQAGNFAHDAAGIKLLLSGSTVVCLSAAFTTIITAIVSRPLYNGTWAIICGIQDTIVEPIRYFWKKDSGRLRSLSTSIPLMGRITYTEIADGNDANKVEAEPLVLEEEGRKSNATSRPSPSNTEFQTRSIRSRWLAPLKFIIPTALVSILLAVRPRRFPFEHMSGSIPFTLLEIWTAKPNGLCEGDVSSEQTFPLANRVSPEFWEYPNGKFPGWMPTINATSNMTESEMPLPSWLPENPVRGFSRWYAGREPQGFWGEEVHEGRPDPPPDHGWHGGKGDHREHGGHGNHGHHGGPPHPQHYERPNYDPVGDPLKISNLDQDILPEIKEALKKSKITIKHVILLSLESTRKDVFPFKKGGFIHSSITNSWIDDAELIAFDENINRVDQELSDLSLNAELLTGEKSGFSTGNFSQASKALQKLPANMGGLNIQGAMTGSTSTLKSLLGSHCGVQPLPVDFTVEAHGPIYQPCIPQVLSLLNHNKQKHASELRDTTSKSMKDQKWVSVYMQSITNKFDHQAELNQRMGFTQVIAKSTIVGEEAPGIEHYVDYHPPTEREAYYFGFAEPQLKPYIRDVFKSIRDKNERLFLSHLTASTHHPWSTPPSADANAEFFKSGGIFSKEEQLNKYLNTVRYSDRWIGEVMDLIDEFGMSNETLVVMVGDHGMTFKQDHSTPSTFENAHINTVRVPLLFHHPLLPKLQLNINATSLSILPTILDFLTTTSSLSPQDTNIAENLIHQYEGQSLLRPFLQTKNGREQYNIGIINAGGSILSVSSAAVPFRLAFPICQEGKYRFTNTELDPNELHAWEAGSLGELLTEVEFGAGANGKWDGERYKEWILEAERVGKWWVAEIRRRWRFFGKGLQQDRAPEEMEGVGKEEKHWWETR